MKRPKKQILLAEDDAPLRQTLAAYLEVAGYTVHQASDGARALALYEKHRPNVVVMDMVMPHMEGSEAVMVLSRRYPEARILAISGGGHDSGETYLRVAARLGAHATLAKPFHPEALVSAIKQLLGPSEEGVVS
ncbi:MAG: response regulator [Verrucomicrobiales bacterium]|nr:response regulator [Verrucomicrobiales bacterium]